MNDIIFYVTSERMSKELSELMKRECKMSLMGKLKFFIGLQIIQKDYGIFMHKEKYIKDLLKRFIMDEATQMATGASFHYH